MRKRRGQATLEYVMLMVGVITPFTFGLIAIAQLMWVYHTSVEFTRMGARYAATHCWQAGAENVRSYLQANIPPVLDRDVLLNGPAEIQIQYFQRNPDTGIPGEFSCDSGECSPSCVPDLVVVRVRNYEFRRFLNYLGLPPIVMPEFSSIVPIESAGCDPETGICTP